MIRRYLIFFSVPIGLVLGPAMALSIYFGPVFGDLTRTGHYAERDFGWRGPQPVIEVQRSGKLVSAADILVLGDSFSRSNIWQSVLSRQIGKDILSFNYIDSGCVHNWFQFALTQPARTIVIETVERGFVLRFNNVAQCQSVIPQPLRVQPTHTSAMPPAASAEIHVAHTYRTLYNSYRPNSGRRVINAPLLDNCASFTNRRADRLLYYRDDDDKFRWDAADKARAISNVRKLQAMAESAGKLLVFVVVPDKSSAYRNCLVDDPHREARMQLNIARELSAAGIAAPDLLELMTSVVHEVPDLYPPNDTHFSSRGYILLAKTLATYLESAQATGVPASAPGAH